MPLKAFFYFWQTMARVKDNTGMVAAHHWAIMHAPYINLRLHVATDWLNWQLRNLNTTDRGFVLSFFVCLVQGNYVYSEICSPYLIHPLLSCAAQRDLTDWILILEYMFLIAVESAAHTDTGRACKLHRPSHLGIEPGTFSLWGER